MKFIHIPAAASEVYQGRNIAHNGMTVGYEFLDPAKKQVAVTFARCSANDQFNKKKSRWICTGRMEKGVKMFQYELPEEKKPYEFLISKANEYDSKCREQARKVADQRTRRLRRLHVQEAA